MASRTVGSPQIRNRGTVGGNLGAASPAGDAHPPLLAAYAEVETESVRGRRLIPAAEFYTGVKRNALQPDELISAVLIAPPTGPQQFCKIGTRNAMVIAVAAFGLALHPASGRIGTGVGSAAPTPRRGRAAEEYPGPGAGRRRPVGVARSAARRGGRPLCRPGGRGRRTDRRRPRQRAVPGSFAVSDGPASVAVGLGRVPEGVTSYADRLHHQRRAAPGRRRLGGREPALRAARTRLACLARRTPASRASAARARSTWTASRSAPAWSRPARPRTATSSRSRDSATVNSCPSAAGVPGAGAVQCGFCTPGLLVAAHDLLERRVAPSDAEIREALAGNLCRCTGYEKILDAVRLAASERRAGGSSR